MKRILMAGALAASLLLASCSEEPWKPVEGRIMTRWAASVSPDNVWISYPRPSMVREGRWQSLNGLWNYAIVPAGQDRPRRWDGRILVPFAAESALSGVGKTVGEENALWYETTFTCRPGERQLLHFDAVDWSAEVWVNGQKAGSHTGGYTRFSLDITPFIKGSGKQTLTVKVLDGTDNERQPRGKQVSKPEGIWYTAVTGIWQTVWLENLPEHYIKGYQYTADRAAGTLTVTVDTEGGDAVIIEADGTRIEARPGETAVLPVYNPNPWRPRQPYLYDLNLYLRDGGAVVDSVRGYAAFRDISVVRDSRGNKRMAVNGEPVFQFGPLDQGWWPDGLYTAPSDAALQYDVQKTKDLGYNMIRKHIKVEPERWYFWCDVNGILVWQDMPSITDSRNNRWDPRGYEGTDWDAPQEVRDTYYKEWGEIIAQLKNHPSIVVWVPYNEGWGQFETEKAVDFTRAQDPTRLVNAASGGNFCHAGDIFDLHNYPQPDMQLWEKESVNVLGEYGGIGCPVEGHLWQPDKNWGYIEHQNGEEVLQQYRAYADMLKEWIARGCAAAVYTQTTDVEIEVNGLMTYDRALVKMNEDSLAAINRGVIAAMR